MLGKEEGEIQPLKEPGKVQKVGSYRLHRRNYRATIQALNNLPLRDAMSGGAEHLIEKKDTLETAARIIRVDLKGK